MEEWMDRGMEEGKIGKMEVWKRSPPGHDHGFNCA
jgi:hypothetical protein